MGYMAKRQIKAKLTGALFGKSACNVVACRIFFVWFFLLLSASSSSISCLQLYRRYRTLCIKTLQANSFPSILPFASSLIFFCNFEIQTIQTGLLHADLVSPPSDRVRAKMNNVCKKKYETKLQIGALFTWAHSAAASKGRKIDLLCLDMSLNNRDREMYTKNMALKDTNVYLLHSPRTVIQKQRRRKEEKNKIKISRLLKCNLNGRIESNEETW